MRKQIIFSLFLLCWMSSLSAQRPLKIGLTLGGGGARGLAHIGVLKVLEEYGIHPDLVTGTSMGSIVGGLYAIGYTPDELEEFAQDLEWNAYFSDTYARAFLPVEERQRADRYQLTFAIKEGKLQLPRGLIDGRKIQTLLASLTTSVHHQDTFNNFYLPFRCIATDLETGKAYVFDHGDLRRAIRASMSIPSVFAPLEYDERVLVDGLLVRNLPVTDALDMGADFVIAVDVGTPLYKRDELGSIIRVLEQSSSFGAAASTLEQRALADFLILPELDPFTTLSYDSADSLILRGETHMRKMMPDLLRMLDSLGVQVPTSHPTRPQIQRDSFYVTEVHFKADNSATTQAMRKIFNTRLPAELTNLELSNQIASLYSSGFLDFVDYEMIPLVSDTNAYQLNLYGTGAPQWMIRASLNYDNDLNAGLLFNATGRNVLGKGSLLSADLRISENPGFFLDYQLYTRTTPSIGLSWRNRLDFFPGRIYENYLRLSAFQFHQILSELSVFSGIGSKILVEAGFKLERLTQNRRFYSFEDGEAVLSQLGAIFNLKRETYDRASFPRRGSNSSLRLEYSMSGNIRERSGENRRSSLDGNVLMSARLFKVFPVGDHFWFDLFSGAGFVNYRERNLINLLYLGRDVPNQDRFFEFYGIRYMEQPVTSFGFLGLKLRQEIGRSNYFSLGLNYGRYILSDFKLITEGGALTRERTEGDLWGLGLELGSITPLGPVRFTTEYNLDRDRFNFSLHAGYYF